MSFDRREFLSFLPGMAALPLWSGWSLGQNLVVPKDRALIFLWLDGGMSHLDTFDLKPEAPPDIRGDMKHVKTRLDGVFFSDHLPKLAQRMHKMVLFRSITHGEGNHDRGSHYVLTGHRPSPILLHPGLGASLSDIHVEEAAAAAIPDYVAIPDAPAHGKHGFLPLRTGPFQVGGQPGRPNFRVKNLQPSDRASRSMELLRDLDQMDRSRDGGSARSQDESARDGFLRQARALSLNAEARAIFDLRKENQKAHQLYGRHRMGQSCLLARRLVQGGARTVLVRDRGWDSHVGVHRALTFGYPAKLVQLDQAVSALVDDLDRLELSEKVMVVVASEFGRTPRLNPAGGRDHWPRAQSVLAFGGGLRQGVVIGKTDRKGEEPAARPISPADLFATIVEAMGAKPDRILRTTDGRPVQLVEVGAAAVREALRS